MNCFHEKRYLMSCCEVLDSALRDCLAAAVDGVNRLNLEVLPTAGDVDGRKACQQQTVSATEGDAYQACRRQNGSATEGDACQACRRQNRSAAEGEIHQTYRTSVVLNLMSAERRTDKFSDGKMFYSC